MRVLVYLSGEPGTGKSTLMTELTRGLRRIPLLPSGDAPARDALVAVDGPQRQAVELGRRRDSFSGTDALPQTAITAAEAYLRDGLAERETALLLAEGARLANRRFLQAAVETGWTVMLVHLDGPKVAAERRAKRAAALGVSEQNPAWVKGRRTAAHNLERDAVGWGCLVLRLDAAQPTADQAEVVRRIVPALP